MDDIGGPRTEHAGQLAGGLKEHAKRGDHNRQAPRMPPASFRTKRRVAGGALNADAQRRPVRRRACAAERAEKGSTGTGAIEFQATEAVRTALAHGLHALLNCATSSSTRALQRVRHECSIEA